MCRIIFHIPLKIDFNLKSASQIRPCKMIDAFKVLGYHVDIVEGDAKQRKKSIKKIKKNISDGIKYDFLYSESSTMPTLLTERKHFPTHPFIDFVFFKYCKEHGIKIGLFYRDVYWCFPGYITNWKTKIAKWFYRYDLKKYNELVDVLFVPSKEMIEFLPIKMKPRIEELPSGAEIKFTDLKSTNHNKQIEIFYVGGIGSHYDLSMLVKVIGESQNFHLTLCCRQSDWELIKDKYNRILSANVSIVHKSGKELDQYYESADLCALFVAPSLYWSFAMPFKLMEFLGRGVPVIASNGTKVAQFVTENDCGFSIDYTEEKLREFLLNINRDLILEKKQSVRRVAPSQSWEARVKFVRHCMSLL